MTLEGLYFASQIAAALAVVGSLIFVGIQIRQNTRMQRAQGNAARSAAVRHHQHLITGTEYAELFSKGLALEGELNSAEQLRFMFMVVPMIQGFEEVFDMHAADVIGPGQWGQSESAARTFMTLPGFRAAYRLYRLGGAKSAALEWLDGLLETLPTRDPRSTEAGWNAFVSIERGALENVLNAKEELSARKLGDTT